MRARGGRPVVAAPRPAGRRGPQAAAAPDINQTPYRVDGIVPPQITGDDEFFDFLFSARRRSSPSSSARAEKGETLAPFTLADVKITVNVDNTFEVISTQLTQERRRHGRRHAIRS